MKNMFTKSMLAGTVVVILAGVYFVRNNATASATAGVRYTFTNGSYLLGKTASPIEIKNVTYNDTETPIAEGFFGSDSLLNGAEVRIKNISNKEIESVRLRVIVLSPDTGKMKVSLTGAYIGTITAPGKEAVGRLQTPFLNKLAKEAGVPVKQVQVDVDVVQFTDGTGWKSGAPVRRVPGTKKWLTEAAYKEWSSTGNWPSLLNNEAFTLQTSSSRAFYCGYFYGYDEEGLPCGSTPGCLSFTEFFSSIPNEFGPLEFDIVPTDCSIGPSGPLCGTSYKWGVVASTCL